MVYKSVVVGWDRASGIPREGSHSVMGVYHGYLPGGGDYGAESVVSVCFDQSERCIPSAPQKPRYEQKISLSAPGNPDSTGVGHLEGWRIQDGREKNSSLSFLPILVLGLRE